MGIEDVPTWRIATIILGLFFLAFWFGVFRFLKKPVQEESVGSKLVKGIFLEEKPPVRF